MCKLKGGYYNPPFMFHVKHYLSINKVIIIIHCINITIIHVMCILSLLSTPL
nr:MAG TPA: hypothetical protein [Caudoviricetes sp.]